MHRKGHQCLNADFLSRLPRTQCGRQSDEATGPEIAVIQTVIGGNSLADIRQSQLADGSVGFMLRAMKTNQKPDTNQLQRQSSIMKEQLWDQLDVKDSNLWRCY